MSENLQKGRVTIPTNLDVVPETIDILKKWGADAIRDCDGTEFPEELTRTGAKIYSTYYTTRKDNAWAKANPDEVQQCYIMTGFYTATEGALSIRLMSGISTEFLMVNERDDMKRWWEVMDRTTGEPLDPDAWRYEDGCVIIDKPEAYHDYT
ncbi:Lacto-N-biose phosphorylase, partial [gut metagenome]